MTQVNSAIPFGQRPILTVGDAEVSDPCPTTVLNPYSPCYEVTFAFSLILCPPENSALIARLLTRRFDLSPRLCRVFLVVSIKVSDVVRMGIYSTIGIMFLRCYERTSITTTYLPFWFRASTRSYLAR